MKKFSFLVILILVGFLLAEDADKVIGKVQKKYKDAKSIHVDFKQINKFNLTGLENEIYGTLWLTRNEDKFRLETEDQTVVSNGETFWRYNKLENQVLVDYAKKSQQDIFLNNFLFKISDMYYSQILSEPKIDGKKAYEVKLTPKNAEESFFRYIKVWIMDKSWDVKRVVYIDYNENTSEYQIEKLDINPDINPDKFTFTVPEGVEVVDLRI